MLANIWVRIGCVPAVGQWHVVPIARSVPEKVCPTVGQRRRVQQVGTSHAPNDLAGRSTVAGAAHGSRHGKPSWIATERRLDRDPRFAASEASMGDDLVMLTDIAAIATAAGVLAAVFQLLLSRRQARASFEHEFVKRYWSIGDDSLRQPTSEGSDVYRQRYLRLCEDEFEVMRLGAISWRTWEVWHDAIRDGSASYSRELAGFSGLSTCMRSGDHSGCDCEGIFRSEQGVRTQSTSDCSVALIAWTHMVSGDHCSETLGLRPGSPLVESAGNLEGSPIEPGPMPPSPASCR